MCFNNEFFSPQKVHVNPVETYWFTAKLAYPGRRQLSSRTSCATRRCPWWTRTTLSRSPGRSYRQISILWGSFWSWRRNFIANDRSNHHFHHRRSTTIRQTQIVIRIQRITHNQLEQRFPASGHMGHIKIVRDFRLGYKFVFLLLKHNLYSIIFFDSELSVKIDKDVLFNFSFFCGQPER